MASKKFVARNGIISKGNTEVSGSLSISGSLAVSQVATDNALTSFLVLAADGTVKTRSTGAQGAQGAEGAQGAQGAVGSQGAVGAQGAVGSQGDQGAQGAQGAAGNNGNNGAQGAQGAEGAQGAQGAAGNNGNNGAQGAQGAAGNNGNNGAQGAQGAEGAQGAAGNTGAQGAAGNTGAQGAQGAAGNTGAQGAQGAAGNNGNNGAQGAQGAEGAQGAAGNTGAQGAQGAAGNNGNNGAQGAQGAGFSTVASAANNRILTSDGTSNAAVAEANLSFDGSKLTVTGSTEIFKSGSTVFKVDGSAGTLFSVDDSLIGSLFSVNDISGIPILEVFSDDRVLMGTFGAEAVRVSGSNVFLDNLTNDGSTVALTYNTSTKKVSFNTIAGPQGAQGAAGNTGAQGAGGNTGAQGAQGAAGNNGNNGNNGAQGAQGAQGAAGNNGNQGAQGAQGAAGNNGNNGNQGAQGAQGAAGNNGNNGNNGAQGAQGAQGAGFSTVSGAVNNRVLTSDGSSNAAVAEAGLTFDGAKLLVSASSAEVLRVVGSGSTANTTIFAVDGNNGRLFEISDDLSNSLFSVNTIAGLPVIEAFADNTVKIGKFNQENIIAAGDLQLSGSIRMTSLASTADTTVVTYNTSTKTIGYNTIAGPQGAQGAQGAAGNNGNNGNQGAQGAAGNNGNNGNQGAQGAQGAAGNNGNNGNQGAQGAQGAAGNNGNNGNQGAQGATGPTAGSANQVVYKDGSNNPAGSSNLTFDGTTLSVNTLNEFSALKYKKDIQAISQSLQSIHQMQGVYFTKKDDESRQIGFIADEIYKVYPELVRLKNGEVDGLQYQRITAVLVEAMKELSDKVDSQEKLIRDLISRITKLESK